MDFYKTVAAFGATACLLVGATVFAEPTPLPASDTFESNAGNWIGDVTRVTDTVPVPLPAGWPVSETNAVNSYVLSVSGSASNTYASATSNPFVDMMVKVSIPDDGLTALDAEGAKFAIAVDKVSVDNETKGQFKYWNGTAWNPVSPTNFAADAWVRVTMKFDYTAKKCAVALNGNPGVNADLLDNNTTSLASLEVRGSTAIDEVGVAQGATLPHFADPTAKNGDTVTYKWLTENNVTWDTGLDATTSDGSGYSYTQKYVFGLKPLDGKKFTLNFEQDNRSGLAALSFPGFGAYGGTGSYVLQMKSGDSWITATDYGLEKDLGNGVNNVFSVLLPETAGTAVRYRVLASAEPYAD